MKKNLGPAPVRSQAPGEQLTAQRAAVLELVQQYRGSMTIAEVATDLGVHLNTAREHLDALAERQLLERTSVSPAGRGRPAFRYRASSTVEPDGRVRDYVGLADALAAHIMRTSEAPIADALAAGEAWGKIAAEGEGTHPGTPKDVVLGRLTELGSDPVVDPDGQRVSLRRCPLLDAAKRTPDVVCNVHLGLVRGTLDRLGSDGSEAELEHFAEPGACILRFGPGIDWPPDEPGDPHQRSTSRTLATRGLVRKSGSDTR